jgi:hypothetical protein
MQGICEIRRRITYEEALEELSGLVNGFHQYVKVGIFNFDECTEKIRLKGLEEVMGIIKSSKVLILDKNMDTHYRHILGYTEDEKYEGIEYDIIF